MARVPDASRAPGVGITSLDGQARSTAQRAGRAIEETGRATQQAIRNAVNLGTELRARRQQAEDNGFTASVSTKARSRFQEVFLESRNQATEGAEDFAATFQQRLDQETEALIEAARAGGGRPSDRAIQDTRSRLQLLGAAFTGQAATFENNARIAKLTRDLGSGLDNLALQAFDDPERRPELMDAADEGIDAAASFLPAADLEALREGALSAITAASVNGVIERDPGLAAEMLEAGDFDKGLEAGRKAAFIAGAKTARRLEAAALAREAAADRRELRRDADAAIAKLRGGQQVVEAGALESRAEALEESETRAALRHAEDDRLFMRGFAQRPPAAQAELIAVLENGPELKPVETRRLAAMQAQAAVTERALAKDPLAYAHSSGVIDEPVDLTDLAPEALRTRLRQAETTAEQYGLASLPFLRPGEAEKIAEGIVKGTPEDLQAKAEELAELPAEIRQAIVDELGPGLRANARDVLQNSVATDLEQVSVRSTDLAVRGSGDLSLVTSENSEDELAHQPMELVQQNVPLGAVELRMRELGFDEGRLRELGIDPSVLGSRVDTDEFSSIKPAAAGEIGAELGGGRFQNGSATGPFVQVRNDEEESPRRRLQGLVGPDAGRAYNAIPVGPGRAAAPKSSEFDLPLADDAQFAQITITNVDKSVSGKILEFFREVDVVVRVTVTDDDDQSVFEHGLRFRWPVRSGQLLSAPLTARGERLNLPGPGRLKVRVENQSPFDLFIEVNLHKQ